MSVQDPLNVIKIYRDAGFPSIEEPQTSGGRGFAAEITNRSIVEYLKDARLDAIRERVGFETRDAPTHGEDVELALLRHGFTASMRDVIMSLESDVCRRLFFAHAYAIAHDTSHSLVLTSLSSVYNQALFAMRSDLEAIDGLLRGKGESRSPGL